MGLIDHRSAVQIAVLGPTGVGKTTYLASLYQTLQTPTDGLTAFIDDKAAHDGLLQAAAGIKKGNYPPGTLFRRNLTFGLRSSGQPVATFSWQDYSGGALDQFEEDVQTKALLEDLESMEALAIFCDASQLNRRTPGALLSTLALANAAIASASRPLAVSVLLTKSDMVSEWTDQHFRFLMGFFTAVAAKPNLSGVAIPVACGTDSYSVTIPILHLLSVSINKRIDMLRQRRESEEERARYWHRKSLGFGGFLREVLDRLTDTPTDARMASAARATARSLGEETAMMEWSASLMDTAGRSLVPIKSVGATDYATALNSLRCKTGGNIKRATAVPWR